MNKRWHEGTRYMRKEGEKKGAKDTCRDLITTRHSKKRHQNVIDFEGRNLDNFFL